MEIGIDLDLELNTFYLHGADLLRYVKRARLKLRNTVIKVK